MNAHRVAARPNALGKLDRRLRASAQAREQSAARLAERGMNRQRVRRIVCNRPHREKR
jgi:protein tyrosine phosphatase (PTP) superfamily phosphohydrolase (DUF442 family)